MSKLMQESKTSKQSISEEEQINTNIINIESFYGLSSVDSLKTLISIIIDQKKSEKFFMKKIVTLSSIFTNQDKNVQSIGAQKINTFAQKYSFEKLVEKFPKPKAGTNKMLISILEKKMQKQVISSHHIRKSIWMLASGAKFSMLMHKDLYGNLLKYENYPDYFMRAIKQDLHRTVNITTSYSSEEDLISLNNVLTAFSRRNPYVGYCQGLNFITFFLLTMQFTEEEAFWLLCQIIETIIPMDYYTNMIGVVCDQQIFISLLRVYKPHIVEKFNQVGLDPSVLSIQWFVCLFTSSLPFYLVKVVWDRLLVEGMRAFIKAGLIILSYFQQQIMNVQEFHEIIIILEKGSKKLKIPEAKFNEEFEKIFIHKDGLKIARNLYRQYYLKEKLCEKISNSKKKIESLKCDTAWPICITGLQKCKRDREEIDVWIFRQEKPPQLIHDYLMRTDKINKKKHFKSVYPQENERHNQQKNGKKKIPRELILDLKKDSPKSTECSEEVKVYHENLKSKIEVSISKIQEESEIKNILIDQNELKMQSDLIIGRMEHICDCKKEKEIEIKKKKRNNDIKYLSMIMEEEPTENTENQEKKIENFKKIMRLSNYYQDQENQINFEEIVRNVKTNEEKQKQEDIDIDEEIKRSQTLIFYSKFIENNLEISQIIGGNMKKEE